MTTRLPRGVLVERCRWCLVYIKHGSVEEGGWMKHGSFSEQERTDPL